MKKVIFVATTYFQLITIINLKQTIYFFDDADIIISDRNSDYENIVKRLKQTTLFKNVFIFRFKKLFKSRGFINKVKRGLFTYIFTKMFLTKLNINETYEEILFYSYDILAISLFELLRHRNKDIIANRFDEGLSSYLTDETDSRPARINLYKNKICKKTTLNDTIRNYYIYEPEFVIFKNNYKLIKMPNINDDLKQILNKVFGYNIMEIDEKYIFFQQCFKEDGTIVDDFNLIIKISKIVGKENLLVKLHPRTKENKYSDFGIKTLKSSNIPWETIELNNDFSDKVYITISSTSVLSSRMILSRKVKTYFLYNCVNEISNHKNENFIKFIKKFEYKFGNDNFIIPKNKKDFFDKLRLEK